MSSNLYQIKVSQNDDILIDEVDPTLSEILKLDARQPQTSLEKYPRIEFDIKIAYYRECFLYHGIRFQKEIRKLDDIFKKGKILAGKYICDYFNYSDNCNEGEYVSLLGGEGYNSAEYKAFIRPNVSLIITPFCDAIKTIYVPFDKWEYIKKNKLSLKNRFSYIRYEYQVKDSIPIEMVRAIGIPYFDLIFNDEIDEELLMNGIISLMKQYDISLPIVDTSNANNILYIPEQEKVIKKL